MLHILTVIVTLVVLEGLLSADNALVMAVMVRPLPHEQQKRALWYGIFGAFVFRFIMLVCAIWIIKLWYLRGAGAAYLAYLTIQHFWNKRAQEGEVKAPKVAGFWMTVLMVNLMDCAFAIDSVLVAVGLSENIWVVFTGVALGIVAVRVAAGAFLKVLAKWPSLENVAYLLIGWISIKLFVESYGMFVEDRSIELHPAVVWTGMGLIAVGGSIWAIMRPGHEVKPPAGKPEDVPDDPPALEKDQTGQKQSE
jgi:YkoY family integral membrane protein